jgi:hypothetical protein
LIGRRVEKPSQFDAIPAAAQAFGAQALFEVRRCATASEEQLVLPPIGANCLRKF